jgi:hypothetical protein
MDCFVKACRRRGHFGPDSVGSQWPIDRRIAMIDLVMLAIGFVFFALSIGYVYACDLL